jgi:hypothetical protein
VLHLRFTTAKEGFREILGQSVLYIYLAIQLPANIIVDHHKFENFRHGYGNDSPERSLTEDK